MSPKELKITKNPEFVKTYSRRVKKDCSNGAPLKTYSRKPKASTDRDRHRLDDLTSHASQASTKMKTSMNEEEIKAVVEKSWSDGKLSNNPEKDIPSSKRKSDQTYDAQDGISCPKKPHGGSYLTQIMGDLLCEPRLTEIVVSNTNASSFWQNRSPGMMSRQKQDTRAPVRAPAGFEGNSYTKNNQRTPVGRSFDEKIQKSFGSSSAVSFKQHGLSIFSTPVGQSPYSERASEAFKAVTVSIETNSVSELQASAITAPMITTNALELVNDDKENALLSTGNRIRIIQPVELNRRFISGHREMEPSEREILTPVQKPKKPRRRQYKRRFCKVCGTGYPFYCLIACGHTICEDCIMEVTGVEKIEAELLVPCHRCHPMTRGRAVRLQD